MGTIKGDSTAEINAPIDEGWAVGGGVLSSPQGEKGLKDGEEIERDGEGHVVLAESSSDAKVRTVKSTVRFSYTGPNRLEWRQEKGDMKSVHGAWELDELGDGRTRATYRLEVDLGRMLGMVIRGPLVDVLRGQLVGARADELKKRVGSG